MPVIVGAPRSGTTLFRFMLDAHSRMAIPPETGFLPALAALRKEAPDSIDAFMATVSRTPVDMPTWPDFMLDAAELRGRVAALDTFNLSEATRCFYELYAARFKKSRYGEKSPLYCHTMPAIESLLPEAAFIHVIRDGRDVALSLRRMWFSPGNDIKTLAGYWQSCVQAARFSRSRVRRYLEIRYEDLILDTRRVLQEACAYLDLPYEASMEDYYLGTGQRLLEHQGRQHSDGSVWLTQEKRLSQQKLCTQPPQSSRAGNWKKEMTPEEVKEFQIVAGELLHELGYD